MPIIATKATIKTTFLVVDEKGIVTSTHPQELETDLNADGFIQSLGNLLEIKESLSSDEVSMLVRTGNIVSLGSIQANSVTSSKYIGDTSIVSEITGTSKTLSSTDNGLVLMFTSGTAVTITVPTGLPVGFTITAIQAGAGQLTFSASSTTINNRQSHTKSAGQWAVVSLIQRTTNNFVLAGDTAA